MKLRAPRLPLFGIILGNATILSLAYLALGLVLEILRRAFSGRAPRLGHLIERIWEALDQLPARILEMAGWLVPLRKAYVEGSISELGLRLVFSLTSVGLIFVLALGVGVLMWLVRTLFFRAKTPA